MQTEFDGALARLAAHQHSLVTNAQARAVGLTQQQLDDRVRAGVLERMQLGVYRFRAAPLTWHARLLAACWAGGAHAVASHRSAAALWGLAGGRRDLIEITCSRWRRAKRPGLLVHEITILAARDCTIVDGIPVTSPELTLMHLAAVCHPRTIEMAYDRARHAELLTHASCRSLVARYGRSGRDGVGRLRALLDETDPERRPTESEMETELVQVLRAAGLPEPVPQHEVRRADGSLVARLDLAWPNLQVALEYQSLRHHSLDLEKQRDRRRIREAQTMMWEIHEVGPDDVRRHADDLVAAVRGALQRATRRAVSAPTAAPRW